MPVPKNRRYPAASLTHRLPTQSVTVGRALIGVVKQIGLLAHTTGPVKETTLARRIAVDGCDDVVLNPAPAPAITDEGQQWDEVAVDTELSEPGAAWSFTT